MVRGTPAAPVTVDVYAAVARLAGEAADHGTFGVGGVLADDAGRVVAEATNAVVAGGRVDDPTAHVERQLVDWYFAEGPRDLAPGALTIVTSLEPCMMCAGSILRAGFRCVALTDDDAAGVGIRRGLPTLSAALRTRAESCFGSAAVDCRRAFVGAGARRFRTAARTADFEAALRAFDATWEAVRSITTGTVADRTAAVATEPDARSVWIADGAARDARELTSIAAGLEGDGSAAGLADADGRLVHVAAGRTMGSPIRIAVMECVRGFTRVRTRVERAVRRELAPSELTLLVTGPFRSEEEAVIALGAAGSFVEAPLAPGRAPFVQLVGAAAADVAWLAGVLARFPTFYRDYVGLRVGVLPG